MSNYELSESMVLDSIIGAFTQDYGYFQIYSTPIQRNPIFKWKLFEDNYPTKIIHFYPSEDWL